ncbi:MAG TPA: aminomethyltransferase family protein [Burkholderiales bacterium]
MSAVEEHLATRNAAGLFDFSFMALYEFQGRPQLQRLQTRDLEPLVPGQIAYTLLLKDDGAVLIDATIWRLDAERFWLFTGKRVPVQALERSGEYAILALQGPASGAILARLIGREAVLSLRYFHFIEKDSLVIGRLGFSGELGYELLVPAREAPRLSQELLDLKVPECGWKAADSLRIESGYVLFDREIDGRANPRELGLARLVGDAARRFRFTRKLAGFEIVDGAPGADLPVARVTSECLSPTLGKRIALGFAPPEAPPGTTVRLADGRAARVAALPFHDPLRRLPRGTPL